MRMGKRVGIYFVDCHMTRLRFNVVTSCACIPNSTSAFWSSLVPLI